MEEHAYGRVIGTIETDKATIERSLVGAVKGNDVSLVQAGAGPVMAGGSVTITQGGCGPVIAQGNVSFERGGCQSVIAAGEATIGPSAWVGLVVSPSVKVEDGGRVLMGTKQAAAFGAALGMVVALFARRRRKG